MSDQLREALESWESTMLCDACSGFGEDEKEWCSVCGGHGFDPELVELSALALNDAVGYTPWNAFWAVAHREEAVAVLSVVRERLER